MAAFFVTSPHSGEVVPDEVTWLQHLPEEVLMCDIDRYVDRLYQPAIDKIQVPFIKAQWHRYVVDLNRFKEDIDADSVQGSENSSGTHPKGLHWSVTTQSDLLISHPMPQDLHEKLYAEYYLPFHDSVESQFMEFESQGVENVFHLDAHSMPSMGTKFHRDPGEARAEVVVSDVNGTSCSEKFKDLVIQAYEEAGFQVTYNWPYLGGRVTERYGDPSKGRHAIQVEMNRRLYMDEKTKQLKSLDSQRVQLMVEKALSFLVKEL